MNLRLSAAFAASALAVLLSGCVHPNNTDGGVGGGGGKTDGGPLPEDKCSGGCGINQICDIKTRTCVDACGGCQADGGHSVCVKAANGSFQCIIPVTQCSGAVCDTGQIACIAGACTCLGSNKAAEDSCAPAGKWCSGTNCVAPTRYQQCKTGLSPCPTGHTCLPVFGQDLFLCTKQCGMPTGGICDKGELCSQDGCLPSGLFTDQECMQQRTNPDGGAKLRLTVPVSNTCLMKDGNGNPTEATPSGNCVYQLFSFYDRGFYPTATCRPAGGAPLGGVCKHDFAPTAVATQCGTGLECALTRGGDQGVCLPMCNAAATFPGFDPMPACGADDACTNIYRLEDMNAVLGVCMKKCNVFNPLKNTCANIGTAPASCVPTTPDGKFSVSTDGSGVCIPQQLTTANAGQPCAEQDSFKGAACGNGQVCASLDVNSSPSCYEVCDTDCKLATPPARCATEPNATCGGGKVCTRITSTSGAIMGFCK